MQLKIVYIAGVGHCGSTILNLILGTSKKTISLGETKPLKIFLEEEKTERRNHCFRCTCGKKLKECKLWGELSVKNSQLLQDSVSYRKRGSIFLRSLYGDLPRIPSSHKEIYPQLLSRAQDLKGQDVEWLVDSSKDLELLAHLYHAPHVDLHVIHLIRDSRANVNSLEKQGLHWLSGTAFWLYRNTVLSLLTRHMDEEKTMRIQYESFARRPEETIKRLNSKWSLDIPLEYVDAVRDEEYHNFAGNSVRQEEFHGVYYDDSWKDELAEWKEKSIRALTWLPSKIWSLESP